MGAGKGAGSELSQAPPPLPVIPLEIFKQVAIISILLVPVGYIIAFVSPIIAGGIFGFFVLVYDYWEQTKDVYRMRGEWTPP